MASAKPRRNILIVGRAASGKSVIVENLVSQFPAGNIYRGLPVANGPEMTEDDVVVLDGVVIPGLSRDEEARLRSAVLGPATTIITVQSITEIKPWLRSNIDVVYILGNMRDEARFIEDKWKRMFGLTTSVLQAVLATLQPYESLVGENGESTIYAPHRLPAPVAAPALPPPPPPAPVDPVAAAVQQLADALRATMGGAGPA